MSNHNIDISKSLSGHSIKIQIKNPNNRVIEIRKGSRVDGHIYITTWDCHLCFSGDYGVFVFKHPNVPDMLKFFNNPVNLGYWLEKLQAGDALEFDAETSKRSVIDYINDWFEGLADDEKEKIANDELQELIDDATDYIEGIKTSAHYWDFICQYRYSRLPLDKDFEFDCMECHDWDCMKYTWRYEFACHAIAYVAKQVLEV